MNDSARGLRNQAYDEKIGQNPAQERSQGHIYEHYTYNSAESPTVEKSFLTEINRERKLYKIGKFSKYRGSTLD